MKKIMVIIAMLIWANAWAADSTWANYYDVGGQEGLSVLAYLASACTGTPPEVTQGGTAYAFTDVGAGRYIRKLREGEYHLFVAGSWTAPFYHSTGQNKKDLDTVKTANWVTNARMADNSVDGGNIVDATVGPTEIAAGAVTSVKVADATLYWVDLSTGIKGSGLDCTKTLKQRFDTLDAMRGNWNASTDFNLDQQDSLLKKLVLNLAFAAPCTVRIDVSSRRAMIRSVWQMNTAHNDSAVYRYRIYFSEDAPSFYTAGQLDSAKQVTLAGQMEVSYELEPKRYTNSYYFPGAGLRYVVVTARDWQGTVWGSAWDSAGSEEAGLGEISSLTGAPGYTAGMDAMTALRDAMNEIGVLKNQQAQTAAAVTTGVRVVVYADNLAAGTAYNSTVSPYDLFYRIKTGGPPSRKAAGAFRKFFGYNRLHLACEARMKNISSLSTGYLYFDPDGAYNSTPQLFGANDATDTTWTTLELYYDVSSWPVDSLGRWCLGGVAADTMFVRSVVVTLER